MTRFAVIGGGISGLTAAYCLSKRYPVTLFDAAPRLGGHTHTVSVDSSEESVRVDMGFIVFNEENYPGFTKLLGQLGVASQPSDMSFGVACSRTGLEYRASSLNTLFAQRRNLFRPGHHRMILDILRFSRESRDFLGNGHGDDPSLGDYVERGGYSRSFVEQFLVPMGASIWSADPVQMMEFPARYLIRFFHHHGFLEVRDQPRWRTVTGGSSTYIAPLSKPFADGVRLGTPVRSVRRTTTGVEVLTDETSDTFDHVVLAVHGDRALKMLANPSPLEEEVLGAIRYQPNDTVLHSDAALLPRNKRARASWNYTVPKLPRQAASVTYYSNLLQSLKTRTPYLVTLNSTNEIRPDLISSRASFEHPTYTFDTLRAQSRRNAINGADRISYCGAYWGFGFHEDGVQSALSAVKPFRVGL